MKALPPHRRVQSAPFYPLSITAEPSVFPSHPNPNINTYKKILKQRYFPQQLLEQVKNREINFRRQHAVQHKIGRSFAHYACNYNGLSASYEDNTPFCSERLYVCTI